MDGYYSDSSFHLELVVCRQRLFQVGLTLQ